MSKSVDDERISLRTLVRYVEDAQTALIDSNDLDAAFRFEMFADYLRNGYNEFDGLKFKGIHLGL